jgi:tetratricopeptide (TPR) repeat protein
VVIKISNYISLKLSSQASHHVLILLILFFIFNAFFVPAQTRNLKDKRFDTIQFLFDKKIGSFEREESLITINQLLFEDYNKNQKNILKVYKLKVLVATGLFDEVLELANIMLSFNDIDSRMEVSILLERSRLYEILKNFPESKKDLNRVARIYEESSISRDENYGRYLSRLSSWYRENGRHLESVEWAKRAAEFGNNNDYLDVEATGYLLLGFNADASDLKKKRFFFNKGLQLWKQAGHELGAVKMYCALAGSYLTN